MVRWPVQKVAQIGSHPLVFGFSGSVGTSQRVFHRLTEASLTADTFKKPTRLQKRLDEILKAEYEAAAARNNPPPGYTQVGIWGLAVAWVQGEPRILEYELSGDSSWHDYFHAVGSGAPTAYAAFRVLGGRRLCELRERTAITAAVRILRTVISVDMWGVSEPLRLWRVGASGVDALGDAQIDAHLQEVDEWEKAERERLFESDRQG